MTTRFEMKSQAIAEDQARSLAAIAKALGPSNTYDDLIAATVEHLDEWHTTDDDSIRRCDYIDTCLLNCFQGSTYDWTKI